MSAVRRRSNYETEEAMKSYINSQPLHTRIWIKTWQVIYKVMAVFSYIAMVAGFIVTMYCALIKPDLLTAILAGLFTVLAIYINKVNPS